MHVACITALHAALDVGAPDDIVLTLLDLGPQSAGLLHISGLLPLEVAIDQKRSVQVIDALVRLCFHEVRPRGMLTRAAFAGSSAEVMQVLTKASLQTHDEMTMLKHNISSIGEQLEYLVSKFDTWLSGVNPCC